MGYKKEYKDYKISRQSWWKFWQIDNLEFKLPTRYQDAYEEDFGSHTIYRFDKLVNSSSYSMKLANWVIEDIRQQLSTMIITYPKLIKKSKSLSVQFRTSETGQNYIDCIRFYVRDGGVYFDSDSAIKREKLLNKLGI